MSSDRASPKFVRIILDLENCDRNGLTPFVRVGVTGYERKEIIVAQHISGSADLYIAVAVWPHEEPSGQLEIGMLGCGDKLGVQLEDKDYSVLIEQDTVIYIPWGGDMEEGYTGESMGQHLALFVNESTDREPIGILGSAPEFGNWDPDQCPDETVLDVKKGLSLCSVPLDPSFETDRQVEFKMVTCADGENIVWEQTSRSKRAKLPADADVVIWNKWCSHRVHVTPVLAIVDLTSVPRSWMETPRSRRKSRSSKIDSNTKASSPRSARSTSASRPRSMDRKTPRSRESSPKKNSGKKSPSSKKRVMKNTKNTRCECSSIELFCDYYKKLK